MSIAKSATGYVRKHPNRKVVEDWIYDPRQYVKDNKIIEVKGKSYLNSFEPNDLIGEPGDTKLLHKLLNHYFNGANG